MAKDKVIGTTVGIALMCLTAVIVCIFGALLSIEYESNCTTQEDTGKTLCTTRSAWKGWSGVPIQSLASAVGIAAGGYAAWKTARKQDDDEPPTGDSL